MKRSRERQRLEQFLVASNFALEFGPLGVIVAVGPGHACEREGCPCDSHYYRIAACEQGGGTMHQNGAWVGAIKFPREPWQ